MDDETLLMLAAKAAGISVVRSRLDDPLCMDLLVRMPIASRDKRDSRDWQVYRGWNPLTSDGDAFRLAVDLSLVTSNVGRRASDLAAERGYDMHPYTATRRALVLAAAHSRDTTIGPHTHTAPGGTRD